jgi:hypothetical protein
VRKDDVCDEGHLCIEKTLESALMYANMRCIKDKSASGSRVEILVADVQEAVRAAGAGKELCSMASMMYM